MMDEEIICTYCDRLLHLNAGNHWVETGGSIFCASFDAVVHVPIDVALIRAEIEHDLRSLA